MVNGRNLLNQLIFYLWQPFNRKIFTLILLYKIIDYIALILYDTKAMKIIFDPHCIKN